jgi:hypothetical protein
MRRRPVLAFFPILPAGGVLSPALSPEVRGNLFADWPNTVPGAQPNLLTLL